MPKSTQFQNNKTHLHSFASGRFPKDLVPNKIAQCNCICHWHLLLLILLAQGDPVINETDVASNRSDRLAQIVNPGIPITVKQPLNWSFLD